MNPKTPMMRTVVRLVMLSLGVMACGGTAASPAPAGSAAGSAPASSAAVSSPAASHGAPTALDPGYAMYKGSAARTGELLGPGPMAPASVLWSIGTPGPIKSSPAVVGDAMFIVAGDGHVVSLDAATGTQRWTTADGSYVGTVTATGGRVFADGTDGSLSALDIADGTRQWHVAGSVLPNHNPLAVADLVIAGGGDLRLHAYDAATGSERWSAPVGGPLGRSASSDGSTVFVGSDDGVLHAFALDTGTVLWTQPIGSHDMTTSPVRDGTIYGGAANADDTGTLFAVDAATGSTAWTFRAPGGERFRSPAVDETSVYAGTGGGPVFALSRADGSIRWTYTTTPDAEAAISVVGDTLYFVGDDNNVIALDKATGAERWRLALGSADGVEAGTTVVDGRVLVGTAAGNIVAVGGQDIALGSPAPSGAAAATTPASAGPAAPVGELTAPGGLVVPADVTVDPAGNLWVEEGDANRFAIFRPDGSFMERWGKAGSGDGEFNMTPHCCPGSPAAVIAFAADGGFYVNDPGNYRVQRFDKQRNYVGSIGRFGDKDGQLIDPQGVAVDGDGLVYVPDSTRGDVQVFDGDGRFVRALTGSGTGASALKDTGPGAAVFGDEVYVVDRGGYSVFKTDGSGVRRIESPAFGNVVDPNMAPDGLLWAADWDAKFHAVDPKSGEVVGTWKVGPGWPDSDVQGIGVAKDGTVYVAEWSFGKVEAFKPERP